MASADEARITALCAKLGDKEQGMERFTAIQELIKIGAPAVPSVMKLLDDPRPRAKTDAAIVLSSMGEAGKVAIPALKRLANDPNPAVSMGVTMALSSMK